MNAQRREYRGKPAAIEFSEAFGPGLDDSGSPILHVDMDAFFAAVEAARRPELRGKAVIVGGLGPRGVVSAASYEARRFDVGSAMPMAAARKRCPHAVFIEPDGRAYSRVSKAVMAIFAEYTPLVEPLSVDEAFLDVSGSRRLFGSPAQIAARIRRRVADEHGVTCTVGAAPVKFLAKLASSLAKPDGLAVVPADRTDEFLSPLPLSVLWGVGPAAAAALRRLGLRTVGDVARAETATLRRAVGDAAARHLHALSRGEDARAVEPLRVEKSVGAETTFDVDVSDPTYLLREALRLSHKTAERARRAGVAGRTVTIKLRYADFVTVTRSRSLPEPVDVARQLYEVAAGVIRAEATAPVRLVGVRLESLSSPGRGWRQPTLDEPDRDWREVERTVDAASDRFGAAAIRPASLLEPKDDSAGERHARSKGEGRR